MAMLRSLAVSLLSGVLAVPLLWIQRGEGFEHARLAALIALDMGQFVGVSVGLVVGFVLTATGRWSRTPGYVLGTITAAFGVLVATQALPTMSWVDGRPSGLGDPDGESFMAFLALASGVFTTLVGLSIVLWRWSGYDPRTAPVKGGRRR
ncbi:hypothetical protein [Nonomuraea wenchangensis]|uniref:hypothetical protein n=1 Tax=Nonomuraea wenchangensis TaxID=568860 RepID=UPI003322B789